MKGIHKGNIFFKLLLLSYIAVVAYLCFGKFDNIPNVAKELWGIPMDKIVHFCMFFPFPIITYLAFDNKTTKARHSIILSIGILFIGLVMAAGTEIIQSKISYRSGDRNDLIANILALSISTLIIFIIDIYKQRR